MSQNLQTPLTVAAELRAAGHAWEAIARKVNRKTRTVRQWPNRLQGLLRDSDPKVKTEAVKLWMRAVPAAVARHRELAGADRPPPAAKWDAPTCSHAEFLAHYRAHLDRWRAEAGLGPASDKEFQVWYRQQSGQHYHAVKRDDLGRIQPPGYDRWADPNEKPKAPRRDRGGHRHCPAGRRAGPGFQVAGSAREWDGRGTATGVRVAERRGYFRRAKRSSPVAPRPGGQPAGGYRWRDRGPLPRVAEGRGYLAPRPG